MSSFATLNHQPYFATSLSTHDPGPARLVLAGEYR